MNTICCPENSSIPNQESTLWSNNTMVTQRECLVLNAHQQSSFCFSLRSNQLSSAPCQHEMSTLPNQLGHKSSIVRVMCCPCCLSIKHMYSGYLRLMCQQSLRSILRFSIYLHIPWMCSQIIPCGK